MDWHLEDVGKIVKTTKVCCGARRVKLEITVLTVVKMKSLISGGGTT